MYKAESVLKNVMHRILRNLDLEPLNRDQKPNLVIIKKK